jgi:hypothetical protein
VGHSPGGGGRRREVRGPIDVLLLSLVLHSTEGLKEGGGKGGREGGRG